MGNRPWPVRAENVRTNTIEVVDGVRKILPRIQKMLRQGCHA